VIVSLILTRYFDAPKLNSETAVHSVTLIIVKNNTPETLLGGGMVVTSVSPTHQFRHANPF
jgi:hypothetical protein